MTMQTGRWSITAAMVIVVAAGCNVENEQYCADDTDCLGHLVCHDEGHFCHEPCQTDEDCTNSDLPGYMASRPYCGRSGDCVASLPDGGLPDAAEKKKNGAGCGKDGECLSGHCVDAVCCDKACDGKSTCTGGKVTGPSCLTGTCKTATNDCHGFKCDSAGVACRTTCSDKSHCATDYHCVGTDCVKELALGAYCGTNGAACKSGYCVDTVCCDGPCTGTCEACDLSGTTGNCTKVDSGQDPDGECKGSSATPSSTCAGSCDGKGACAFPGASTSCGAGACASGTLTEKVCDGKGGCGDQTTPCKPYICDAGGTVCATSCENHAGCHADSACDRSGAHADVNGHGECVDTSKIVKVGASEEIADALGKVTSKTPYVVIDGKAAAHTKKLSFNNETVHLIGKGTAAKPVTLSPSSGPAIAITDATISVQGLTIDGLKGTTGTTGYGVTCAAPFATATLTVVESFITNNPGIGVASSDCDVTLRRTTLQKNDMGAAKLTGGKLTLVNNLVTNNGTLNSSLIGGLEIKPAGAVEIYNNTIASNSAQSGQAAGVICAATATIYNSILWGNVGAGQHSGCMFDYSDVQGGVSGSTNRKDPPTFVDEASGDFSLKSTSLLIDKGTGTGKVTTIDLANDKRLKGTAVDMGAYEVK